ncbi:carbohydrate ABC transporter permease, partial [Streptomyces sp. NPDC001661]
MVPVRPWHGAASCTSARHRAKQHHAGPLAYILLGITALVSLFPLYWTLVAAS